MIVCRCNDCGASGSPKTFKKVHDKRLPDGSVIEWKCPVCRSLNIDVERAEQTIRRSRGRIVEKSFQVEVLGNFSGHVECLMTSNVLQA